MIHQAVYNAPDIGNVVFIYLCYGVFASPCPATFVRIMPVTNGPGQAPTPPPSPPQEQRSYLPSESVNIILTSEMRPGSSGIVHIGTLEPKSPSDQRLEVAVKLAFSQDEKETLAHEHRLYSHLHSKGVRGIPKEFGLFVDEELVEGGEGPYALIMSFAGQSLFRRSSPVDDSAK
jgi:hypothetical protein